VNDVGRSASRCAGARMNERVGKRPLRGFTLIEVLVALAIVAIGMAALMSALTSSANSTVFLRDKTLAEWVALNQIETARLSLQRPSTGKTDGEAEMAGRKWKWHQEVVETEVKGIRRIDVSSKPSEVSGDSNWYATMSGITGDALAPARGDIDFYARQAPNTGGVPPGGNPRNPNGQPGTGNPLNGGGTGTPGTGTPTNPTPNPGSIIQRNDE
jgi:general secretion pathway protein I